MTVFQLISNKHIHTIKIKTKTKKIIPLLKSKMWSNKNVYCTRLNRWSVFVFHNIIIIFPTKNIFAIEKFVQFCRFTYFLVEYYHKNGTYFKTYNFSCKPKFLCFWRYWNQQLSEASGNDAKPAAPKNCFIKKSKKKICVPTEWKFNNFLNSFNVCFRYFFLLNMFCSSFIMCEGMCCERTGSEMVWSEI